MAKSQDAKKTVKKEPLKTPKEKKAESEKKKRSDKGQLLILFNKLTIYTWRLILSR